MWQGKRKPRKDVRFQYSLVRHTPNHLKNLQVDPAPKTVTAPNSTTLGTKPSICGPLRDTPGLNPIRTFNKAEDEDRTRNGGPTGAAGDGAHSSVYLVSTSPWMCPQHCVNQVCLEQRQED